MDDEFDDEAENARIEALMRRVEALAIKIVREGGYHSGGIADYHESHIDLEECACHPFDDEDVDWDHPDGDDFSMHVRIRIVSRQRGAMEDHLEDSKREWNGTQEEWEQYKSSVEEYFANQERIREEFR